MKHIRIAVLYNEPDSDCAVSRAESEEDTGISAHLIGEALSKFPFLTVSYVPITRTTISNIARIQADCVFNCIEWTGHDLSLVPTVFGELAALGIPVTGSGKRTYIETTDKITMKKLLDLHNVPTPRWAVYAGKKTDTDVWKYSFPAIVKLALEHCGVGLDGSSIVYDDGQLIDVVSKRIWEFHQSVLVEEYIAGREFEVTIIDDGHTPVVLPVVEYKFDDRKPEKFLTYDAKWNRSKTKTVSYTVGTADLPEKTLKDLSEICRNTYRNLGFWGYARFDVRLDAKGHWWILETNSNPGIDDDDDNGLARSFHSVSMTLGDFCLWVIYAAYVRYGRQSEAEEIFLPSVRRWLASLFPEGQR